MSSSSSQQSEQLQVKPLPVHWQFTAGAVAGILEIVCMYPLDIVKTRFQLTVSASTSAYTASKHQNTSSIFQTLKSIVQKEGFLSLYRGMLAPILVEAPKRATKFATNDFYTKQLTHFFAHNNHNPTTTINNNQVKQQIAVIAGIGAGMSEALIVTSFDVVKIRMQDPSRLAQYHSTIHCIRHIIRNEGIAAFTQGLEATVWRHGAWNGGYFGVIFLVKEYLQSYTQKYSFTSSEYNRNKDNAISSNHGDIRHTVARFLQNESMRSFVAGVVGGTVGTICNTPFDVVKTRIQNQERALNNASSNNSSHKNGNNSSRNNSNNSSNTTNSNNSSISTNSINTSIQHHRVKYRWALPSMVTVLKEEGLLALYKGFLPKVLRLGPGGGLLLVVYEQVLRLIRRHIE